MPAANLAQIQKAPRYISGVVKVFAVYALHLLRPGSILRMVSSQAAASKRFIPPWKSAPGIEVGDRMITARNAAYPISYANRQ